MIKALAHWGTLLGSRCFWKYFWKITKFIGKEVRCQGSQKVKHAGRVRWSINDHTYNNSGHWQSRALIVYLLKLSYLEQISFLIAKKITHFIWIFRWLNKIMHVKWFLTCIFTLQYFDIWLYNISQNKEHLKTLT